MEQNQPLMNETNNNAKDDNPGVGWQILAFLIPLAGLIMYFNNKKEFPNKANRYGLLALISFGIGLVVRLT